MTDLVIFSLYYKSLFLYLCIYIPSGLHSSFYVEFAIIAYLVKIDQEKHRFRSSQGQSVAAAMVNQFSIVLGYVYISASRCTRVK